MPAVLLSFIPDGNEAYFRHTPLVLAVGTYLGSAVALAALADWVGCSVALKGPFPSGRAANSSVSICRTGCAPPVAA